MAFGAHSLLWDTLLRLDAGCGAGFVLPQLGMPDFLDYPKKALPPLRSGGGGGKGGRWAGQGEGEETAIVMYNEKNVKKKVIICGKSKGCENGFIGQSNLNNEHIFI